MAPVAAAVGILVGAVRRSVQGAVCWCVMTGVGSGGMTEAESGMMGAVYLRGRRMHGEMVRHACILVVMVEDAGSQCCLYWRMPQHARLAPVHASHTVLLLSGAEHTLNPTLT